MIEKAVFCHPVILWKITQFGCATFSSGPFMTSSPLSRFTLKKVSVPES